MLEAAENILPFGRLEDKASVEAAHPPSRSPSVPENEFLAALTSHLAKSLPSKKHSLHDAAQHHFKSPGKMLRSRLALAACLKKGMPKQAALDWAVAIELLHNASLVHDDICDNDRLRRDLPSLWAAYGQPLAICFGDWLIGKSFELAAQAQAITGAPLTALMARTMSDLSTGQAAEFNGTELPDCEAYLSIVGGKTTPLFMAAIEGAFFAGDPLPAEDIQTCRKMFEHIGFAYQIANDIENHKALKAGAETGDLLRGAPNAVYIMYRALLTDEKRTAFDHWQKSENKHYAEHWLNDIAASEAETLTYGQFADHLAALKLYQAKLSPTVAALVAPIGDYLSGTK